MKKIKKLSLILACGLLALIFALCLALTDNHPSTAVAHAADGSTRFRFLSYSVTYDIRTDRTMDVTMDLTAYYEGYASTGFIYDIPVNAGDRVRNINAYKLVDGRESPLEYSVKSEDSDFVSVYMDDYRTKRGETHSYRITYEYAITKPVSKNNIYLNATTFSFYQSIENVCVVVNLPEGLKAPHCYVGREGTKDEFEGFSNVGNRKISLTFDSLPAYNGVSFDFEFENGVLSTKPDMTPYWIIIGACAVFAVLFAIKLLFFNKQDLTPIPSFSVPANPPSGKGAPDKMYDDPTNEMDPLMMGKLIDNKVDSSDVTSMLYYWASKGYIKINMMSEENVEFVRVCRALPGNAPAYQQVMFRNLFLTGDRVQMKTLTNTFYSTVETVTKMVNSSSGFLRDIKSMVISILFAVLGGLVMGLTPLLIAKFTINGTLLVLLPLVILVPAAVIYALTVAVRDKTLKLKKTKLILMYAGVAALALLFCGLYVLLVPSYVIEIVPKLLICAIGFAIIMLSVWIISRSEEYCEKLNRIVGFREFIETAEKDKLEEMLESNPEFYYNILPYAIVLGVSDKWEKKFEGLTVRPPQWASGRFDSTVFNIIMFNSLMRSVNINMVKTIISRPSSSSRSGGSGGHFGGFGGGGHGGGGFRGK